MVRVVCHLLDVKVHVDLDVIMDIYWHTAIEYSVVEWLKMKRKK